MDTPSPSTASTTAHAVGYNDEPSITAAPLRSTDDLAVDAPAQLSSLILTTEATATPQRIVESVTSLTSSGILAEGQRMPTVRDLARLLRTSPATVSSAYHALARSGILRSRGRAGTFVLRQSRTHRYDAGDLLAEAPATAPDRPIIDLSKGTPDLSLLRTSARFSASSARTRHSSIHTTGRPSCPCWNRFCDATGRMSRRR